MHQTTPYRWDLLTRFDRATARATRSVARVLDPGGSALLRTAIGDAFESMRLAPPVPMATAIAAHRGPTFSPVLGDAVCVHLVMPGISRGALLAVDRPLADAIVGAMLGSEQASAAHDPWDFGVFAHVVSESLSAAAAAAGGSPLAVDVEPRAIEWLCDALVGPGVVVEIAVDTSWEQRRGWVRLFLPGELLEAVTPPHVVPERLEQYAIGRVTTSLALGIGRVRLTADEIASLRPGDAVLLRGATTDGPDPPAFDEARAWLSPDSWLDAKATGEEGWSATIVSTKVRTKPGGEQMNDTSDGNETTQLLAAAGASVEAVVGRAELSFDALARLTPGAILETDRGTGDPVDLVANGTIVARGELVDVEGRLGVRILSMVGRSEGR